MRGLLGITVLLAALWAGWWAVGARGAKGAAEAWFAAQAGRGITASYEDLTVLGFPNRFDLTVTAPSLADPATGLGWTAPFAQIFAMSWKPWHLIAALPGGQVFSTPDQKVTLNGDRMMASFLMVPGTDLAFSELVVQGDNLHILGDLGLRAVGHAVGSMRAETGAEYRLGLSAKDVLVSAAFAGDGPGERISEGYLDAHITLSAPLDRHMSQTRPRLTGVAIDAGSLVWGKMALAAKGRLQPDANGFASGEVEIRVTGWQSLPPALAAAGLIAPDFAPVLTRGLAVMAAQGATADVLVIAFTARGGRMSLGPLPLGPAPWWGN